MASWAVDISSRASSCRCRSVMNRYHFLTLWHRPTLSNDSAEPFAVIVELREDAHHELFGILKSLSGDDPDSVSGTVLANLPEILTERILAVAKHVDRNHTIVEALRSELTWNIYAEGPEHIDCETPLRQTALRLFGERVDAERQALTRFRKEHIEPRSSVSTHHTIELP